MPFNTNTKICEMQHKNTFPKNNFAGYVLVSLDDHYLQSLVSGLYLHTYTLITMHS